MKCESSDLPVVALELRVFFQFYTGARGEYSTENAFIDGWRCIPRAASFAKRLGWAALEEELMDSWHALSAYPEAFIDTSPWENAEDETERRRFAWLILGRFEKAVDILPDSIGAQERLYERCVEIAKREIAFEVLGSHKEVDRAVAAYIDGLPDYADRIRGLELPYGVSPELLFEAGLRVMSSHSHVNPSRPNGVSLSQVVCTTRTVWQVGYADRDQIMDPETREVLAERERPTRLDDQRWRFETAPDWDYEGHTREIYPPLRSGHKTETAPTPGLLGRILSFITGKKD